MLRAVVVGLWLIATVGETPREPAEKATPATCLFGRPPYSFADFWERKDGGSIAGTARDSSGAAEEFWWDREYGGNGPVYWGTTDGDDLRGREIQPGNACEAALIGALRRFADAHIAHELQAGLVEAMYDGATPTGEVAQLLKSPSRLLLDAVAAAHMARELAKHLQ